MAGFTDTLEQTGVDREAVLDEPGDHERLSHYVNKNDLMEAMLSGNPVTALCGKVWVPTRDGLKFPPCPECKEIWEGMPSADE